MPSPWVPFFQKPPQDRKYRPHKISDERSPSSGFLLSLRVRMFAYYHTLSKLYIHPIGPRKGVEIMKEIASVLLVLYSFLGWHGPALEKMEIREDNRC
jgi:hypothetical protein